MEEREPWTLPNSIFKSRIKECDARAFYDSHQVGRLARGWGGTGCDWGVGRVHVCLVPTAAAGQSGRMCVWDGGGGTGER
jgi:hypothetical protein